MRRHLLKKLLSVRTFGQLHRAPTLVIVVFFATTTALAQQPSSGSCLNAQTARRIGSDFLHYSGAILKSPSKLAHLDGHDALWIFAFSAATATLLSSDGGVSNNINPSHAARHTNNVASNILTGGAVGYSVSKYLIGCKRHNAEEKQFALRELEAMGFSLAPTEVLKLTFRRQRPSHSPGDDTFFKGGNSFPSGHAAMTAAFATVIAEEYPESPWKWAAVGVAAGTPTLRITAKQHYPSDAFVGSTIGILTGRYLCRECRSLLHSELPAAAPLAGNEVSVHASSAGN